MKIKFEWEKLELSSSTVPYLYRTVRAKVFGGWLVKYDDWCEGRYKSQSMVFVADPNHEWEIE